MKNSSNLRDKSVISQEWGVTVSHHQLTDMGISLSEAWECIRRLKPNYIRVCCYWSESEPAPNAVSLHDVIKILEKCQRDNIKVICTVGMKAPRWPEFYIPSWIKPQTVQRAASHSNSFIAATITALKKFSCIHYWQIENEPLDPSGPDQESVPESILAEEIDTARKQDSRPIIVTLWGNELSKRNLFPKVEKLADVIGLDIYYKVPIFGPLYSGPRDSDSKLAALINSSAKPVWITELQAEPWEKNQHLTRVENPPSLNPVQLEKNLNRITKINSPVILLWGFEYWVWRQKQGDDRVLNVVHKWAKSLLVE